jgi:hypothetical protein
VYADIATGHHAGADILFLIAAIVLAVHFALCWRVAGGTDPPPMRGGLIAAGLCLMAVGWLVL